MQIEVTPICESSLASLGRNSSIAKEGVADVQDIQDGDQLLPNQPDEDAFSAGGTSPPALSLMVSEKTAKQPDTKLCPSGSRTKRFNSTDSCLNVPHELTSLPNWVIWRHEERNGELTKVPYDPKNGRSAKVNDASTWSTFECASSFETKDGIGFMLKGSEYVGLDFDGVIHEGVVDPYVCKILQQLGNPYAEVTPSGKGIRAFVRGALPQGGRRFGRSKPEKYGVEIYSGAEAGRYLTITGNKHSGTGIPSVDLEIPYLMCSQFLDEGFTKLWMGNISGYNGDDSRADLALCGKLAKHFNNDPQKIENAFNQSVLGQRKKWQQRPDYRKRTIRKATAPVQTSITALGQPPAPAPSFEVFDLMEFLELNIPRSKPLLGPILREKSICELYAWRGVGKTFVSLGMGLAVAGGQKFLKWQASEPHRVLYLDGEMAGDELQMRLRALSKGMGGTIPRDYFFTMNFDTQTAGIVPNIANLEGQKMIEDIIGETDAKLVIFDNLSCLAQVGDLDDEAWLPVSSWFLSLRRQGISCLLNHHANKNGSQRGISRREDPFDVVMKLAHPKNYRFDEGLRCELTFEKARGFKGQDAAPLEIELRVGDGESLEWTHSERQDAVRKRVGELLREGLSLRDISDELGVSKSTVGRIKRAIEIDQNAETDASIGKLQNDDSEGVGIFADQVL